MLSICLASTTFFIQLLVVSYSYVRIFKSSKKHFYRISAGKNTRKYNENYRGRTKKNFKAIKTIGSVLSACIITLMPNLILLFVNCYHARTKMAGLLSKNTSPTISLQTPKMRRRYVKPRLPLRRGEKKRRVSAVTLRKNLSPLVTISFFALRPLLIFTL